MDKKEWTFISKIGQRGMNPSLYEAVLIIIIIIVIIYRIADYTTR
jgi:hypothetical protein